MAREFTKGFYTSRAWIRCRKEYAKSKGGLCEVCLSNGIIKAGDTVHHKIHINEQNINDPKITMNHDNLELVCRDCHAMRHRKKEKRYRVDEFGRVAPL